MSSRRGTGGQGFKTRRFTVVYALAVMLVVPGSLWAHARLVGSDPQAGAVLTRSPQAVRVWFDDELDPDRSTITVWDVRLHQADDGKGGVDLNDLDRTSMMVRLRPIGAGPYTVRWRAVAADDGFVSQGSFTFAVRP